MIKIPGVIPITIYPIFWVIAVLIGWMSSYSLLGVAVWTVIVLISVLVHEFGHALTAMAFGQRASIDLVGFGGLTQRYGPKIKHWQDFIIVLNGPIAGLCLAFLTFVLRGYLFSENSNSLMASALLIATQVNIIWTLLNLLPVLPLDGGRLLSIVLEGFFGIRGIKLAYFLSLIFAVSLGIFFFIIQWLFAGALFLMMAFESYRSWQGSLSMSEHDQKANLQSLLKLAEENLRSGQKSEAEEKLVQIRSLTNAGVIFVTASQMLGELYFSQGNDQKVFDVLYPLKKEIDPHAMRLLHQSAYRIGAYQEAIELGNRSYQVTPNYETALINALCYAVLGQESPAIGWLQCSEREGLPNLKEVLNKREFDKIRDHDLFQKIVELNKE